MTFNNTNISGAYLVQLKRFEDFRGYFTRAWSEAAFAEKGLVPHFVDWNISRSKLKGTVRGLHYQKSPHGEAKYLRCTRGTIFDVFIDLRADSPTYLTWDGFVLNSESSEMIYVPEGCAHGFMTLEDESEVFYGVSSPYSPGAEAGIRWDDRFFNIEWPDVGDVIATDKDRSWPAFDPMKSR